jgi:hypothetical protein
VVLHSCPRNIQNGAQKGSRASPSNDEHGVPSHAVRGAFPPPHKLCTNLTTRQYARHIMSSISFIRIIYSRHSFVLLWLVCGRCFTRTTIPSGRSAPSRERTTPAQTNTPWMVTYVSDERITSMVPFSCIRTLLKRSIFIYQPALVCDIRAVWCRARDVYDSVHVFLSHLICFLFAVNHLKYLDFDFTTNWIDCEL